MQLEVRNYDLDTSEPTVLLHEDDCRILSVSEGDRVRIAGTSAAIAIVSVSDTLVRKGTVLIPPSVQKAAGTSVGGMAEVTLSHTPESVRHIRSKMDGRHLSPEAITQLVDDVVAGRLSRIETSAWLTALYIKGMDTDEIAAYAKAMAETGDEISFNDKQVLDFHSFGGLPGNKITPIVVSIVAAAGLTVPKLSSRAISSACGTADFVETFCRVDLDTHEIRRIADEVGGVFSWTGATDLGPAGDRFITVQRPLGIDPRPQLLASIMSKKVAAGATDLVMDIPMGTESKVPTLDMARSYARDLMELGDKLEAIVVVTGFPSDYYRGTISGDVQVREMVEKSMPKPDNGGLADFKEEVRTPAPQKIRGAINVIGKPTRHYNEVERRKATPAFVARNVQFVTLAAGSRRRAADRHEDGTQEVTGADDSQKLF